MNAKLLALTASSLIGVVSGLTMSGAAFAAERDFHTTDLGDEAEDMEAQAAEMGAQAAEINAPKDIDTHDLDTYAQDTHDLDTHDLDTHDLDTHDPDTRDPDTRDLERKLADARARLEEAAHEVAELSSEMGGQWVDKFMVFNDEVPSKALIGVQLDPKSGQAGARIQEVSPGGPADEAGLRAGDVITSINGTQIKDDNSARQVMHMIRKIPPDTKMNVRVSRDGKARDVVVTTRGNATFLGMREPFTAPIPPIPAIPPMPPMPPGAPDVHFRTFGPVIIHGGLGDMELATLTPQLGRYFGTDKGVLVVRAPKDFKLEDGDVILAIDGREPTSGSHATRILASYQPGEKVSIKVMRQQKRVNVETTLPERRALTAPGHGGAASRLDGDERDQKTRMIPHKKGDVGHLRS